jgi:hypothetical protein
MDQLWVKYSNGKFGFSVQKQIWLDLGGKLDGKPDFDTYRKLGDRVGWRQNNKWLSYDSYTFSTNALPGHLPGGDNCRNMFLCLSGRQWERLDASVRRALSGSGLRDETTETLADTLIYSFLFSRL